MQMPDAAIVGKFVQGTLVPEKTPASFAKFLRTPFYRTTLDDSF